MSQNTPAQSGRARALAHRQSQLQGTQAPHAASSVAASSVSSSPASAGGTVPASVAGRNAAKARRTQQINGRPSNAAPAKAPRVRKKPELVVEAATSKTQLPVEASEASVRSTSPVAVASAVVVEQGGRSLSKAYRKALSKGRSGQKAFVAGSVSQAGAKVKLANPDASSREVAKQVRAERCSKGKVCAAATPPSRQPRQPGKVTSQTESLTLSGQSVTGDHVGQSGGKMTGAAKGGCSIVSGSEYLGAEEFIGCDVTPVPTAAKVSQAHRSQGLAISGAGVSSDGKVTGYSSRGNSSSVTGFEYVSANTNEATGSNVTGGEQVGSNKITGFEDAAASFAAVLSKSPTTTARGSVMSAPQRREDVGKVTLSGDGASRATQSTTLRPNVDGAKQMVTSVMPKPEQRNLSVTGAESSAFGRMTGVQGGCQSVSGTPYVGTDAHSVCTDEQKSAIAARVPSPTGAAMSTTGTSPSVVGLTGAQAGACQLVTGTGYHNVEQTAMVCDSAYAAQPGQSDFPVAMNAQPFKAVPAEAATITGDGWDTGSKVTGTDGPWASQRNASIRGNAAGTPMSARQFRPVGMEEVPVSPITGSSGNTDTGAKVTLSGGARA